MLLKEALIIHDIPPLSGSVANIHVCIQISLEFNTEHTKTQHFSCPQHWINLAFSNAIV